MYRYIVFCWSSSPSCYMFDDEHSISKQGCECSPFSKHVKIPICESALDVCLVAGSSLSRRVMTCVPSAPNLVIERLLVLECAHNAAPDLHVN